MLKLLADTTAELDEAVAELEPDMAPTLLMKTAESSRASCKSHRTNEMTCAPGVVVWLTHSGREVKLYMLV